MNRTMKQVSVRADDESADTTTILHSMMATTATTENEYSPSGKGNRRTLAYRGGATANNGVHRQKLRFADLSDASDAAHRLRSRCPREVVVVKGPFLASHTLTLINAGLKLLQCKLVPLAKTSTDSVCS